MDEIYEILKERILSLDENVFITKTINYYGFKLGGRINKNFANVYVRPHFIKVHLSTLGKYDDPKKLLSQVSHENWNALRNFVELKEFSDLTDNLKLIEQSYQFVRDDIKN